MPTREHSFLWGSYLFELLKHCPQLFIGMHQKISEEPTFLNSIKCLFQWWKLKNFGGFRKFAQYCISSRRSTTTQRSLLRWDVFMRSWFHERPSISGFLHFAILENFLRRISKLFLSMGATFPSIKKLAILATNLSISQINQPVTFKKLWLIFLVIY